MISKTTFSLMTAGALLGGGFPGSLIAFQFAATTGFGGLRGEAACVIANMLLGIAGVIGGLVLGDTIRGESPRRLLVLAAVAVGALAGILGYFGLDYAISYANPAL